MQSRTLCLIATALLAGCGGGGPKSDPEAVHDLLKDAAKAVADGDGDEACGYLTPAAQQQVVQIGGPAFGGADCSRVVGLVTTTLAPLDRHQIEDAEPQTIEVTGTTATARVVLPAAAEQGRALDLQLQKTADGWRISALSF